MEEQRKKGREGKKKSTMTTGESTHGLTMSLSVSVSVAREKRER